MSDPQPSRTESLADRFEIRIRNYVDEYHTFVEAGRDELATERQHSAQEACRCLRMVDQVRADEMITYLRENGL